MTDQLIVCPYCGRDDFTSKGGLSQHITKTKACSKRESMALHGKDEGYMTAQEFLDMADIYRRNKRDELVKTNEDFAYLHKTLAANLGYLDVKTQQNEDYFVTYDDDMDEYEDAVEYEEDEFGDYHPLLPNNEGGMEGTELEPETSILEDFDNYLEWAEHHLLPFTQHEMTAIELMRALRQTKASLATYEAIMEWHFRACGKVRRHEVVSSHPDYVSRRVLLRRLKERYNMVHRDKKVEEETPKYNFIKEITLPSSRAKAKIVTNDTKACIQSLLTDPRIRDEDYLFHNDDPFCPPPDEIEQIGDLNTGIAYTTTYDKLIRGKPGKKVPLPVVFYIDGAATAQFSDQLVTALKFTFGIFTREARNKPYMWRTLGYVPKISKGKSRGRRKLHESGHVDSLMAHQDMGHGEGNLAGGKAVGAQDLHAILAVILAPFVELQNTGFIWDLHFKKKVYKAIEFVPFTIFFKVDTDEAEKLTGKYTSRTGNVKCLCRYCCCPTSQSDEPRAKYPRKTVKMIADLVKAGDKEGLKNLSQQYIDNALYRLKFGAHSEEGIHGACPMEMLHALLLGIFKYVRDCFFEQIGPTSQLADEINALAVEYGGLLCRQSDRDMPKTTFGNGIQKGKLMAKEYPGVLLIMATILRSTEGRKLLRAKEGSSFAEERGIADWILLIETLLQWEMWLKSDVMEKKHVVRAEEKHLFIMYLLRKVGNRVKGMGLKIVKYHSIMHYARDIMSYGVPMNYDTGADESGHKASKAAAKLTQKRHDTFDSQLEGRLEEVHCLDLAMEEIGQDRPLWRYFEEKGPLNAKMAPKNPKENRLGGGRFEAYYNEEKALNCLHVVAKSKTKDRLRIEQCFVDFVAGLGDCVADYVDKVQVRTTHFRNGAIFRGSPLHSGSVWRDWVAVDWGDEWGILPNKIWGFVDLNNLPQGNEVEWGGLSGIPPGCYAIVENGVFVEEDNPRDESELLMPIEKEVGKIRRKRVTKLKFYLADVEAFVEPITVVPDIGGEANAYFGMRQRRRWAEDFAAWLERDFEEWPDFESDSEDDQVPYAEGDDGESEGSAN